MSIIYIFVFVFIIVSVIIALFLRPKRKPKTIEKIQNRFPTKCFDCINNNQSLNHLNVSHGYPRVYAT